MMTEPDYIVHFSKRPDGIVIFRFREFTQSAIDHYTKIVRAANNNFGDKLRVMYDFLACPPPKLAVIRSLIMLQQEVELPRDTRTAYVVKGSNTAWIGLAHRPTGDTWLGEAGIFDDEDKAIRWLKER